MWNVQSLSHVRFYRRFALERCDETDARRSRNMQKPDGIKFDKLLGFKLVTRELSSQLSFQDETISAKLEARRWEPSRW